MIPWPAAQPDYSRLRRRCRATTPRTTTSRAAEAVKKLEDELRGLGKTCEFFIYPGTEHAFTNHHRPEVHHEEHTDTAWVRTIEFLRANVT